MSSTSNNEITIWLDSYDEMFSDFDPRPYSKRTISDDFIFQVRKVLQNRYREKMTLKLLIPQALRNSKDEELISASIHNYFEQNRMALYEANKKNNRRSLILICSGFLLMLIASYISFMNLASFYYHVLLILFEPAGWFMLWMGLDKIAYYSSKAKKDLNFFTHMAKTEIEFSAYN